MQPQRFLRILKVAVTIILLSLTLASSTWAAEYKILYKFQGDFDGWYPKPGLTFDAAGSLYGTTESGGAYMWYGTAFKLTPNPDGSWSHSVIHSFNQFDGSTPKFGMIFDAAGNLYGTTAGGGPGNGTVFKLTPNPDGSWSENVIHSFTGNDGESPVSGLVFDDSGNLYGTTPSGGAYGYGTAFQLTPNPDGSWNETVLHSFNWSWKEGRGSLAGLILDAIGNLYGTTSDGGAHDYGTVFKLTPNPDGSWSESTIYSFGGANGRWPQAGLALDAAGNLYGTTSAGGAYDLGTVFKLTVNPDGTWTRSKLHTFKGPDGTIPNFIILDAAGNLYGTTARGGPYNCGTAFKLTPNPDGGWTMSKLHVFRGRPGDGCSPWCLTFDVAGNLYGTTFAGGKHENGVVFRITP